MAKTPQIHDMMCPPLVVAARENPFKYLVSRNRCVLSSLTQIVSLKLNNDNFLFRKQVEVVVYIDSLRILKYLSN